MIAWNQKKDCEGCIDRKSNRLEMLDDNFSASGGRLFEQRTELKKRKQQIEIEMQIQYEKLLGMASGDMPLYLVKDLLKQVEKKAEIEKREKDEEIVLKRLPLIFDEYKKIEKGVDFDIYKFLAYIKGEKQHIEYDYNLTDESYIRLKTIEDSELIRKKDLRFSMDTIQKYKYELNEINNQLEIDLNDVAIQKIYAEIKKLTAEIAVLRDSLNRININLNEKRVQVEKLENEEQKLLDKAASELDEMDDTKRIIEYAEKELQILEIYKARMQEQSRKIIKNNNRLF